MPAGQTTVPPPRLFGQSLSSIPLWREHDRKRRVECGLLVLLDGSVVLCAVLTLSSWQDSSVNGSVVFELTNPMVLHVESEGSGYNTQSYMDRTLQHRGRDEEEERKDREKMSFVFFLL